jgi:hypothetical protein
VTKLADLLPFGHVLRFCAPMTDLPRDQCTVPDRCQDRNCQVCGQVVHWDPKAAIPLLGPEFIVCSPCVDRLL